MQVSRLSLLSFAALLACLFGASAHAQTALDRVQPPVVREERAPDAAAPSKPARIEVDAPPSAAKPTRSVRAGAIVLHGLRALEPGDFADILATRVAQTLSPDALSELASAIAARARDRGFVFASAWIGAQQLRNGVLTVEVEEGRIDEIRFDGPEQAAVRAALTALTNGLPVHIDALERRLLIAGDIDGVRISGTRFLREGGKGVLLVKATVDRIAVRMTLANEGTRPVGPEQLTLQADIAGVFAHNDSISLTWSETPAEFGELHFGRVRYEKRISRSGTELALSASGSVARPGAYLKPYGIRSRSWYVGATALQPLLRRRAASLWFEGELGVRNLSQQRKGTQVRDDRVVAARTTLYGYADVAGGKLRASTIVSQGLGVFGSTLAGDPLASRWDADGTFTTLSGWADWTRDLGDAFSLRLSMISQLSSDPLLISEEIGLGGSGFLRGYDWSERSGDEGVAGLVELRYGLERPLGLVRRAQLYAFADGGKVTNHAAGFGSGSLASAGGGIRTDVTRSFGANLEVAMPLTGARYDTIDETPKINFRLVKSF
ncbi:ShlB/FhaC/HecB family hemolysin secretion/activation protein [Sphingomonas sp. HF-S4]|uniref:ShlB/FhaC/HecB family hemolysin secretion/activation protein n=1 Tax=Sphingomonas agrestis TaxID=3080540 RepID=A0ABU3Y4W0_9SPHN|nr:ShlB/FhaC/HecB family hemolysin secretion/activation protein [Sphingomonas sp. HF-S4]MDV3456233.1 ShlB/FhaC/HecB family hemolysin secretion/activation protein [Sphingomonas sp. HF-S4]